MLSCWKRLTKVLWSSWVEIHPGTANKLGIERGDILEVSTQSGKVRAPAYLYLGIRTDTIALAIGQGHSAVAKLADHKLYYSSNSPAYVRSHSALLSLVQALAYGVYALDESAYADRIKAFRLK